MRSREAGGELAECEELVLLHVELRRLAHAVAHHPDEPPCEHGYPPQHLREEADGEEKKVCRGVGAARRGELLHAREGEQVEFWTFGCYNCRNTLPYVKGWDERYPAKGFTVIGVHSPEFDKEREIEHLRREVASLGITYPMVTDNDYQTWKAYNVEAWPTTFLVDKQGRIRWRHVGEGGYGEAERLIQKLLAE